MEAPDFWDDAEKASADMKELKDLKSIVERADALSMAYDDIMTLIEMGNEEADESLVPEVENEFVQFQKEFEDLRITTMLTGEHDAENAILTLHAGAGGTESCDWASMLCRMYEKWADKRGFTVEVLDSLDGDEAGLKSVTLEIQGDNAYGYLKSEHGVHRLVRISPFNAAGKRQTSFVSCDVMPDIKQDIDIEIADDDIRIDTYRSSGAGGHRARRSAPTSCWQNNTCRRSWWRPRASPAPTTRCAKCCSSWKRPGLRASTCSSSATRSITGMSSQNVASR